MMASCVHEFEPSDVMKFEQVLGLLPAPVRSLSKWTPLALVYGTHGLGHGTRTGWGDGWADDRRAVAFGVSG
jgi:hypothetical protein